jgi:glycosyltransferase involved in cell wall biosynthesis
MLPDISVLLPCYRLDSWLSESLESIKDASGSLNVELVVVVNNLDLQAIAQVSNLCERVLPGNYKIIDAGKVDLVGALNAGIAECTSELIARMDQDDIMVRNRLEIQMRYMRDHPDVSLLGSGVEIIDNEGQHIGFQFYPETHNEISSELMYGNCFSHPAVIYRKTHIEQVGLYDSVFTQAEDFAMYVKFCREFKCANLKEVLLKYRVNDSQTSQKQRKVQEVSTRSIILKMTVDLIPDLSGSNFPGENKELEKWITAINSYVRSNYFSVKKLNRKNAKTILNAICRSHIAIARSSGYRGKRQFNKTSRELTLAFVFGPLTTIQWLTRRLKSRTLLKFKCFLNTLKERSFG